MNKKFGITTGLIVVVILFIFIFINFSTNYSQAFKEPAIPAKVRDVLQEYAKRFPQGRLDSADRIGDRFFIGIIIFPREGKLDVRYVLVGKFREWEPIAEFEKLPY